MKNICWVPMQTTIPPLYKASHNPSVSVSLKHLLRFESVYKHLSQFHFSSMATYFNIPLFFIVANSILISVLSQLDNYLINMDPSAMPSAFSGQHSWHLSIVASLPQVTKNSLPTTIPTSKLLYSYTHVMNGFSASLTSDELEALKSSPGYVSSMKDKSVKYDTTRSTTFLGLNPNSGAWKVSNYGEGIIIGVVDSGIWPESDSYNDDGMPEVPARWKGECSSGTQFNSSLCNKKLIGAKYFNKGLTAKNITVSMNSARDTDGHGTHTSSTAAGNFVDGASFFGYATGTARGVAPKAHVAMYKALWDEGTFISDVIAAIDQAIIDGVDVLSMSLGLDGVALYEDPLALATFAAVDKNIFVSTSAGNQGPFFGLIHNGIPWVLTVAAGTIDREFVATLKLGNGVSVTGPSLYPGNYSASQFPLVFMGDCLNVKELRKVGQKIVVCEDNNGSISDQLDNLQNVTVAGSIFIINITDIEFLIQNNFPAILVYPKDGEIIKAYIKSGLAPKGSLEFRKTNVGLKNAPSVTSYTSRGPSGSCPFVMKPDIMAPGSLVLAAWPDNVPVQVVKNVSLFSKFNLLSGTSMACPHAAGVAALVKKAHPDWSPAAIRSAMMTTADTMDHTNSPIKDIGLDNDPANPLAMGAGEVNPDKAIDPGLVYDVNSTDYVNLLCALNFTQKQIKTITKSSSVDCSKPNVDLNYPSFITFFNANDTKAGVTKRYQFHRTVTNVAEGMSTYIANITPIKGLKIIVTPSKLSFSGKNDKQDFTLVIEGALRETLTSGSLSWVESGGGHVVKSPIVATTFSDAII